MSTPWLLHPVSGVVVGIGPHRYHVRVPVQVEVPVTPSVAVSVPDWTLPVPMLVGDATSPVFGGLLTPAFVDRLVLHWPIWPRAKSNNVELVVVDERVSAMNVLKHEGAVPLPLVANAFVRLIPP